MGSGLFAQLGLAKETVYGTYTVPTLFSEFVSESLKYERERIDGAGIRAGRRTVHRWAPGVQRVAGDIEIEAPNVGAIGRLLWLAFGGYAFGVDTPVAGANTHTFSPGVLKGKSATIQVGRPDIGGTVRAFSYLGCKVTDWELAAAVNEYAKLTATVYGQHETTAEALAVASYPAAMVPFVFHQGVIKIAGVDYDVREVTVSGSNGLAVDRHQIRAGGEKPKEPEESERREYTAAITSDFVDLAAYNRFVDGAEAALSLKFTGGLITGATPFSLEVVGNVRFDGETPVVAGAELLEQPLPARFVGTPAGTDADAIKALLVNNDLTYA